MVSNAPFGDRQPVREEVFSSLDEIAVFNGHMNPTSKADILNEFEAMHLSKMGIALRILRLGEDQFVVGIYEGLPFLPQGIRRGHVVPSHFPGDTRERVFPEFELLMNQNGFARYNTCGLYSWEVESVASRTTLALRGFIEDILTRGIGDSLVAAYPSIGRYFGKCEHTEYNFLDVYAGWVQMPPRPIFRGREQAIDPHEYLGPGFPGDVCDPNRV